VLSRNGKRAPVGEVDDGKRQMQKLFVDSKLIAPADFDFCWPKQDYSVPLAGVVDPSFRFWRTEAWCRLRSRSGYFAINPARHTFLSINTTSTWIWRAPSRRDLQAVVRAAHGPDEQVHPGRHRKSLHQQAAKELAAATPTACSGTWCRRLSS